MPVLGDLYKPSLALLTDLYQLTMACAAFRAGLADHEAVFHLSYRKNPFGGGFAIACGLEYALEYLNRLRFEEEDVRYLATLTSSTGERLFEDDFLEALADMPLGLDVDAIPEGTAVFPHEPLLRVRGPVIPCLLAETPLLNIINFQTLVATKAARIVIASRGEPVLEFGLRRAQGIDGALTASRAAFVGGCAATSNVLAGRMFGIPVRGTHAHSWVMLFDTESEAFDAYARALPHNCVFLVDTYDTRQGVANAIETGKWLRKNGHELLGLRLDSGDLAELSVHARQALDEAGFTKAHVFATNDLDEHVIQSLKEQGAKIAVWGVGTRLVTAHQDAALGGVYKLAALRRPGEGYSYRIKLSEQSFKISTPGVLQVRRFRCGSLPLADAVFDEERGFSGDTELIDPFDSLKRTNIASATGYSDLLVPALRGGKLVAAQRSLTEIREQTLAELEQLPNGLKRFLNPHLYPVGLDSNVHETKTKLVLAARRELPR